MPEYPAANFVIKSNNLEELEVATDLFNEASAVLKKQNIPFRIEVRSGSFEFSIQILVDLLKQVSENPTIAAAVGGAVGAITHRILDRKRSIKKLKFNAPWKNLLKLQKAINRNLNKKIEGISRMGETLKVRFVDGDKVSFAQVKLLFTSRSEREKELERRVAELEKELLDRDERREGLEQALAGKVDTMGTQDLIIIALRLNPKQRIESIKSMLADWGKAFGSWFEGGNFAGRLIKKGLVKKDGQTVSGEGLYSLTKKGELEADRLIGILQAKLGMDERSSSDLNDYWKSKYGSSRS